MSPIWGTNFATESSVPGFDANSKIARAGFGRKESKCLLICQKIKECSRPSISK
jgi:hypothetical protein